MSAILRMLAKLYFASALLLNCYNVVLFITGNELAMDSYLAGVKYNILKYTFVLSLVFMRLVKDY